MLMLFWNFSKMIEDEKNIWFPNVLIADMRQICEALSESSGVVTMVDGLPRPASEHIVWSCAWNLLRIVQNSETICSFRMRYLAYPWKFYEKSFDAIKELGLHNIFMKSDEIMNLYIEESNLHGFRQGIRISNCWKLILMKNIDVDSKLNILREPDLVTILNQQQGHEE